MSQDPKQIAMRYRAIFGPGWQGKMAACMDVQASVITNQVRGHCATQHWFASYIEFFEVTPRALWPERWAALREAADKVGSETCPPHIRQEIGRTGPRGLPFGSTGLKPIIDHAAVDRISPLMAETDLEVK